MEKQSVLTPSFNVAHDVVLMRPLTVDDWECFRGWVIDTTKSHGVPPETIGDLNAKSQTDWQRDISQTAAKFFAAFDAGKIAALSRLMPAPMYEGTQEAVLEVKSDYGRRGIGTYLYKLMKDYMTFHHPDELMIARILPHNEHSRHAAENAGLSYTGYSEQGILGQVGYMIYSAASHPPALQASIGFQPLNYTGT